MRRRERGIHRRKDGSYAVRLEDDERSILAALPSQLRGVIATDDPSTGRLFPPAFVDDQAAQAEYLEMVRDGLLAEKLEALRVFEQTAGAERLTEHELGAWLGALESLRLVLGTQLDVREDTYTEELDPADSDTPRLALYAWLSWLQEECVEALAASLP